MSMSVTHFGNQKAVFANQDDGIFSAIPITFDEAVLTLETYMVGHRKFVKAGSVVKQGETVKGITAEEYEITDGPINGRVVLEGYVYVDKLTAGAVSAMSLLPKIVPIPYGKIVFGTERADGLTIELKAFGTVWSDAVAKANIQTEEYDAENATGATIESVAKSQEDDSVLKVTFSDAPADGAIKITAVAVDAVVGAAGKVISGLPITIVFKNGEVCK